MADFSNIIQEINTNIPDNNTQSITAAKLRTTLIDLTNTIDQVQDDFETEINNTITSNIVDNLNSTDTDKSLSANQGRVLGSLQTKFTLKGEGNTAVRTVPFVLTAGNTYRVYIENPNISLDGVSGSTNYIFYVRREENQTFPVFVRYSDGTLQPYYEFKVEYSGEYVIGMRCKANEEQNFTIVNISDYYNADNIKLMPDVYYKLINNSGDEESSTYPIGIKYVNLKKGQIIIYHLEKPTTYTTRCNVVSIINGIRTVIDIINPNSTLYNPLFGIYKAEADCTIGFSFFYSLNNWYRIVDDFELENANGLYLYRYNKFGTTSISYQISLSSRYGCQFYNPSESGYITIFFKIPSNQYNRRLLFKYTNNSYDVIRIWGIKDYNFIATDTNNTTVKYTDVFGNFYASVMPTINNGNIDTVGIVLQKQSDYTSEEYDDFKLENPYATVKQFNEVRTVPNLIYENNVPVGSVVNFRDQGYYAVVKDKPTNSFGDSSTYKKISLIDTTNIPIEDSMAELANVMNVISSNVGATNSNWKNPYGGKLYSVDHAYNRTTAKDMVRLMIAATKYPELIATMGTEIANVHIYGAHDRDKTLKNNSWDKLNDAYAFIHGSGSVMPYSIVCVKPGATYGSDGPDSLGNIGYATGLDGVTNTGYSMVGIAKINDKYIAFDAANISQTGTSSDHYTQGRLARARATIELLDACKAILEGGSASGSYSYLEKGAAAIIENSITPYCVLNTAQDIQFLYTYNGDDLFQPASTSKVVGGIAILSVLSNMEEYHSIWNSTKELINDSGSSESNPEGHIAYAGDVESVRTSLYAMILVSNGANTLSLGRMAGEKIIKAKKNFIA